MSGGTAKHLHHEVDERREDERHEHDGGRGLGVELERLLSDLTPAVPLL